MGIQDRDYARKLPPEKDQTFLPPQEYNPDGSGSTSRNIDAFLRRYPKLLMYVSIAIGAAVGIALLLALLFPPHR
jgi:hypothetical protein